MTSRSETFIKELLHIASFPKEKLKLLTNLANKIEEQERINKQQKEQIQNLLSSLPKSVTGSSLSIWSPKETKFSVKSFDVSSPQDSMSHETMTKD